MKIFVTENYAAMSLAAADYLSAFVAAKPDAAVTLATGNSPIGLYRELAARRQAGHFDASRLRVFQLDGYLGINPEDPRSLFTWLAREFLIPLGVPMTNVVRLPGNTGNPALVCHAYDQALAAVGGYDLALLGLGPNGHLGYNDPPAPADAPTRVLNLTAESIAAAGEYFGGIAHVPPQAITAGMVHLLNAKQLLLIVSGAHKRDILARALNGPMTPEVPASYLQQAKNVTIIADRAAWPG